jgi:hypothetical protein
LDSDGFTSRESSPAYHTNASTNANRGEGGGGGGGVNLEKLTHFVEYPAVLDLTAYLTTPSDSDGSHSNTAGIGNGNGNGGSRSYSTGYSDATNGRDDHGVASSDGALRKLIAVVVHKGASIGNGHYVAYVNTGAE